MNLSRAPQLLFFFSIGSVLSFQTITTNRFPALSASELRATVDRRTLFRQVAVVATTACLIPFSAAPVAAEDAIEMKLFVDPLGLFLISTPSNYFRLRRSSKGDLPDSDTGKGRRGSSIFTAGDMGKAEIVAVERFPTRVLLEENGVEAVGDLSTFPKIGEAGAIANLINLRREKDKPGSTNTQIFNAAIDPKNDKILRFMLKSEIEVQKPELLMEQYGVDRLFRITTAKASLESNDGNILAVFASALETDFNGPDGVALQQVVDSFVATDQSAATSTTTSATAVSVTMTSSPSITTGDTLQSS